MNRFDTLTLGREEPQTSGGAPPAPASPAPASPTKLPAAVVTEPATPGSPVQLNLAAAEFVAAPGEAKEKPSGAQICVRNLGKDVKEEDVRKLFEGVGTITAVSLKTLKMPGSGNGTCKGYGFVTFSAVEEAKKAIEAMHEKPQEGKGKDGGKDGGEKGKGKGKKGKGKTAAGYQYPYGYYPSYSPEQLQAIQMQYYQYYQQALQAQAYYSGFTGGVIPSEAAISAAAKKEGAAPPAPSAPVSDKEYIDLRKSISAKNGYGFITCSETKVAYGRDVFVDASLLPDIEVKSKVSFKVELSEKGHPRAAQVSKIED
eukprot:g11264.t1